MNGIQVGLVRVLEDIGQALASMGALQGDDAFSDASLLAIRYDLQWSHRRVLRQCELHGVPDETLTRVKSMGA